MGAEVGGSRRGKTDIVAWRTVKWKEARNER